MEVVLVRLARASQEAAGKVGEVVGGARYILDYLKLKGRGRS